MPARLSRSAADAGRAFTLIELVVVLAVVAILVALLLPAVQAARESARRNQCTANLRQIGLAMEMYHDAHNCFPLAAMTAPDVEYGPMFDGFGWPLYLLPYLDQGPLYDSIAPDGRFGVFRAYFEANGRPYPGCDSVLPVFRCPSSTLAVRSLDVGPRPLRPYQRGYGTLDYKGCIWGRGAGIIVHNGVFDRGGPVVRLRDVTDGPSNTIIVGESSYPGENGDEWPTWAGMINTPASLVFETERFKAPINCRTKHRGDQFWVDARSDVCALSFHPSGAQFLFADGHVRFLSESIDALTYQLLGSRADGESVSGF
jgi:prepilin-type N-terminal cleavage/methylation domain-containing protein/prepilin-type processing-associated H-X9-DG protein